MIEHSFALKAVDVAGLAGNYDVVEHLHSQKFGACKQSASHVLVILARRNAPGWMVVDRYERCTVAEYAGFEYLSRAYY